MQRSSPEEREALAKKVGSSVGYFYQIAGGHKKPGPKLCRKLVAAEPGLTLPELRPDIWPAAPSIRVGRRSTDKPG